MYAIEDEPLGTGGGIRNAFLQVEGDMAFTMNGDSLFRLDFNAMRKLHASSEADITIALLTTRILTGMAQWILTTRKDHSFIEKLKVQEAVILMAGLPDQQIFLWKAKFSCEIFHGKGLFREILQGSENLWIPVTWIFPRHWYSWRLSESTGWI